MKNKVLEYYHTLDITKELFFEMIKSKKLMRLLQNGYGNRLPNQIAKVLASKKVNENDLTYLEECIINSDSQLDKIKPVHFPDFPRLGLNYKEQFQRAIATANIGLNSAWSLIESFDLEQHKRHQLMNESKKLSQERFDALVKTLDDKIDELGKMTHSSNKSQYRFSELWMNNYRWAINLCGYRNRDGITEEHRRKSLEVGVYRIGSVEPIIEYIQWLIEINESDSRFKRAIVRWRSDIKWLSDSYK
jgi:hypothetical protein